MRALSGSGERRLGGAGRTRQRHGAGDDSTAEHARLALGCVVEDAGLSGGNTVLAGDQLDFKTIGTAVEPGGLRRAGRADLDVNFAMIADRFVNRAIAEP